MVEFNIITNHTEEALRNMKKVFALHGLNIDILELREAPILNTRTGEKVRDIYVLNCFSRFDDYVRLTDIHGWKIINCEDRITLVA